MKVWCHTQYDFHRIYKYEKGVEYELEILKSGDFTPCQIKYDDDISIGFAYTKHGLFDPIRYPLYTDYFYDIYTHRNSEIDKILSEDI